jgi:WD40 repeat protein
MLKNPVPFRLALVIALGLLNACSIPETEPVDRVRHVEDGAYAADISPSGNLVVMSGVSNGIRVWRTGATTPMFNWQHQGGENNTVTTVHISADENYVVTSDREAFALWSVSSGEPIGFWRIDESSIRDIAVSNNGRGILVARGNGKVMFFEPETGRRLEFLGHQEKVNSIDISPNGRYALTGGNDYVAYLWDTQTGQVVHQFDHDSRVTRVSIDDQGRYVFTADSKRQSQIWDVQSGEAVSTLKFSARQKIFTDAVFSSDGKYLLTGSPARRMNLWSVETGDEVAEWKVAARETSVPKTAVVYGVGFTNNGAIMSASSAGITATWEFPKP